MAGPVGRAGFDINPHRARFIRLGGSSIGRPGPSRAVRAQSERREYRLQPWRPGPHVDGLRRGYSAPVHDENYIETLLLPAHDRGSRPHPRRRKPASYLRSQRYLVLDQRNVGNDDLSASNLMAAVVALEQSQSPADLVRVVDALRREQLQDPRDRELMRPFAEWVRRLGQRLVLLVNDEPPPMRTTLEYVRMTLEERVLQWPRR